MEKSMPQKSASPAMGQNGIHMRPDWAAMQAYYGSQYSAPPYLSSAVAASPHGHFPYLWVPPQSMIPPYGHPYAAFYAHGGFFGHTGVPVCGTAAPSMDAPVKLVDNTDGGFMKKLKEFDGLAMSIGYGNADNDKCETTSHGLSESQEPEGSGDGSSNGLTAARGKRRGREGSPNSEGSGKARKKCCSIPAAAESQGSPKEIGNPTKTPVKTEGNIETPRVPDSLSDLNVKPISTNVPHPMVLPSEEHLQDNNLDAQDEGELKRERRKLSNRESARRSRLRKQAETEELATKVRALTSENLTLNSEMNKLRAKSLKLKLENVKMMDKLMDAMNEEAIELKPDGTQNLLDKVNRSDPADRKDCINPVTSLRQILDNSHRKDAVAAG